MKDKVVYGAKTIQYVSVCIVLVVTKIEHLRTWTVDVTFAYLQFDKPLIRKTLITNIASELKLFPEERFKPLKPIFG